MATLERREQTPGKVTYRVRWWADNKQRSKSFKVHADARRWKAVLEGDLVNGSYVDPKDGQVTVASFINEHSSTLTMHLRASTRARTHGIYAGHLIPEFGHMPLTAVTTPLVAAWVARQRLTMSDATVNKNGHVLSKVFDLAVSYGLIRSNPVAVVRLPSPSKREQRFLTHGEALTLADAIDPRFKAMVLVAVFGGLRYGEIAALRRSSVDTTNNTLSIRQTLVEVGGSYSFGPPKTRTSVRTVTIPRSIMGELVAHMDAFTGPESDALIFTSRRGTVLRRSWFYRVYWLPAVKAADVEGLRFHDLRHTFVAMWVSLGRNPKQVSQAAGHCSVAFTLDRYGHLYDHDDANLADELDAMLLGHIRTHQDSESSENDRARRLRSRHPRPGHPAQPHGQGGDVPFADARAVTALQTKAGQPKGSDASGHQSSEGASNF